MQVAILATGTELTRGELVNGNAAWLSDRLTELGLTVVEHAVVPDDAARIATTLGRLAADVDLLLCTGGLGPTSDDLTAQSVATLLGVPLQRDAHTLGRIHERFRRFRRVQGAAPDTIQIPPVIEKMADLPQGARVLDNDAGTAPGFAIQIHRAQCYFFPGVPREMTHLFERYVVPDIRDRVQRTHVQRHIRVFGLGESQVAERVSEFEAGGAQHSPAVTLGYRAHFPEIELKILAQGRDEAEAAALADSIAEQARTRLSPHAYGGRHDSYPAFVGAQLRARKLRVALAESCTGGLLAKLLTDAPGSSDYFQLSVVTYADSAKRELLGVSAELLAQHGAVSAPVAAAMAEGVLARSQRDPAARAGAAGPHAGAGADLAVAITGVAGPGGGTDAKPVGTVWFAIARHGRPTHTERRFWPGERDAVRTWAAYCALQLLLQSITADAVQTDSA